MKKQVVRAFQELLSALREWQPYPTNLSFWRLEVVDMSRMEEPFIEDEVFAALKEFSGDKAPGLDGFSMAF